MYVFVWIGSLLFWLTCLLLCMFCCSPTIPEMMKKDVQQKFKPRVFKISTYEFILWSSQKFLVTILFSRWMIMDSKYYGYAFCYYCYFGQIIMQIKWSTDWKHAIRTIPGVQNSTNCSRLVDRDLKVISVYHCV